ncbi:hypothetical protein HYPDE_24313 [Hyphomicrobium denitrificans 1NES1]|uniref:Uncharacterized protein n=1 Tax=Hyphomicrobium denitrificans 1NES1 TaxID=670307 RepID=N0B0X2_9HYPH|nr:hypothetical protein HYPDE_24313 [Hyphomicrobium denitrificans 1NES1]
MFAISTISILTKTPILFSRRSEHINVRVRHAQRPFASGEAWRPISPHGLSHRVPADDQFRLVITKSSSSQM